MEGRFIEGQTVDLSILGSEGASAHTTSVLDVSEEEIILRRPPTLNGADQGGVVVEFRPEGDQAPPERGEIESVSDPPDSEAPTSGTVRKRRPKERIAATGG